MNSIEIERMACLEPYHWWYQGLRDMIARTLAAPRFTLPDRPNVLDAGCGTGENLLLLSRLLKPAYLGGFDISPQAVERAKSKLESADIYVSDVRDPSVHVRRLNLIVSFDVVSIAGVADSIAGLARLVSKLQRGGLFILNLPAFRWLFSTHDKAIGTRDRCSVPQVRRLLQSLGLSVELITYRVCSVFPAIVAKRAASMLQRHRTRAAESDLYRSSTWLNRTLSTSLSLENLAVTNGMRLPWGSSVYAVGRLR